MILKELENRLDGLFLKSRAMSWDNAGLQLGDVENNVKKIHISLDIAEHVLGQAIQNGADLILCHHPLIFKPLKTINTADWKGKLLYSLIEKGIAVYAAHTNYDIDPEGLSSHFMQKLGLKEGFAIQPYSEQWYKFVIFVPPEAEEKVRHAICSRGGGKWRDYSCCTFNTRGTGTFFPQKGSQPYSGQVGKLSFAKEVRIECILNEAILEDVVNQAVKAHPYQEAAYDVYRLENRFEQGGMGVAGRLEKPENLHDFLKSLKDKLGLDHFRWSKKNRAKKMIEKVAVVWGSANSLKEKLERLDCDLIMAGELNEHNVQDLMAQDKVVVELGHGISEKWAIEGMYDKLRAYFAKEKIDIGLSKSKNGYHVWRYDIGERI